MLLPDMVPVLCFSFVHKLVEVNLIGSNYDGKLDDLPIRFVLVLIPFAKFYFWKAVS